MQYPPVEVKVWGDFALFTRPEQKIERVSYEVPTPSAARGILEAIFWHRPMQWRIREIVVLKPIRHFSILRNEVKSRMSERSDGLSITDDRSQRHTLGLRDVSYIIRADIWLPPGAVDRDGIPVTVEKYRAQFRRRVSQGKSFHRPYFGCREFAANFAVPDGTETPIMLTDHLGRMLLDIAFGSKENKPEFFEAQLKDGVLRVPQDFYERENHV